MKNEEIDRLVLEASFEIEGRNKIKCKTALDLAEKYQIQPREVSKSCNRIGIKITACQLGLFK